MILQFYFTLLILILQSVVYGNSLGDENDAQSCTELCAAYGGTATFEAGHCTCTFPTDNNKEANYIGLMNKQTMDLNLDSETNDLETVKRSARCLLGMNRQFKAEDADVVAKYFMSGSALESPFFPKRHSTGSSNQLTSASNPMTGATNEVAGSCNPLTGSSNTSPDLSVLKPLLQDTLNSVINSVRSPKINLLKTLTDQITGASNPKMTGTQSILSTVNKPGTYLGSSLNAQPQGVAFNPLTSAAHPIISNKIREFAGVPQFINAYPMAMPNGIVGGQQLLEAPYAINTVSNVQRNTMNTAPQYMTGNAPVDESVGSSCVGSSPSSGNDNVLSSPYQNEYQNSGSPNSMPQPITGNAPTVESVGSSCVGSPPSYGNDNIMSPSYQNEYENSGSPNSMPQHMTDNAPMVESVGSSCVGSSPSSGNDNVISSSYPNLYQNYESFYSMPQYMTGNAPMGSSCVGSPLPSGNDNGLSQYLSFRPRLLMPAYHVNDNSNLGASNSHMGSIVPYQGQQNIYSQSEEPNSINTAANSLGSSYCLEHASPVETSNQDVATNVGTNNDDTPSENKEDKEEKPVKFEKKLRRKSMKDAKLSAKKRFRTSQNDTTDTPTTDSNINSEIKENTNQSDNTQSN